MEVKIEELERYLEKWKEILRLRDWDILIEIVETKWRKSGDIKVDIENRKAILLINRHPKCENIEELIVHELIHVKLYKMDMMIEDLLTSIYGNDENDPKFSFAQTQFMTTLESTVEDLTKGYLALANAEPLSFGSLRNEVEEEIGGK
ncbi:MAG: hypothetical protein K8T10_21435 [Candidatus Eremiobacteraeota bacterium]|nr:hypothetical protein [Candidatus Eremiobacteraeota bacterium]